MNDEPWPGALRTRMPAPIKPSRRWQIANPSPVPPYCRVVEPSACENCSKMRPCADSLMPMPVSRTVMRTLVSCSPHSSTSSRSSTSPSSVNLIALPNRLVKTWRSRNGSPRSTGAASWGKTWIANSRPLASAGWANIAIACSADSTRLKSTVSSSRWPDSILEKSRMSLITPSRCCPEACTACAQRCWTLSSWLPSSNSFMPSTPFIGVRISWLMVARNSLLVRLDASAAFLARSSSEVRRATSSSNCSRCSARRWSRSRMSLSIALKPSDNELNSVIWLGSVRRL